MPHDNDARPRNRAGRLAAALAALAALGWFLSAAAATGTDTAAEKGVLRATLSNGLRVVIVRNTLAPVVATSVNYLVGSDEAPEGFPGLAHAEEHMMFRGSPGLTADQLADIGSVVGGDFNANTREGLTQYLFTVPSEDLDVALHIEALRMRAVLDTPEGWNQERGAIEQEVAQDLSEPSYILYEKLRARMFDGTPYAHDALGTRPSFEKTTAQMLKSFHDTWYAPNNAILVIAGDVDPSAALAQVRELFGDIGAKKLPPKPAVSLQAIQPTSFTVDTDRPNGTLMIATRTPGPRDADFPALELLADVLSSRRFALYELVPQGKAISADFSVDPLPEAGLAYAVVSFTTGEDPKALDKDVRAILTRVAREGVPAELVEAAKLQERSAAQFQRNSIPELASVWSDALALYGLSSPDEDLERIERVTVADVNRVAHKYLDLDHAITGVMLPRGSGAPTAARGGFGGQESISLGEAHPTELPVWAQKALQRLQVPPSTLHATVSTLPNGVALIVQPEDVSDTVGVYGHIRNRPEMQERKGQEGISQLLSQLLTYGSAHLDRVAFQQALDAIGAREHAGTDFSVEVLADSFDRAVELLADNELNPALPEPALQVIRGQIALGVAARNQSPGFLTQRSLRTALYPPDDPSLRLSTPETVRSLTLADVRAYHAAVFRPDLTTIVVIGKIDPQRARAVIEKYFAGWHASGPKPNVDLPAAPDNKVHSVVVPDASRVQDRVVLAQNLALTRSDADYYPLQLGNAVLGGSFYSTRLSIDLRKNSGLVYTVESVLQAGRTRSVYLVDYASDPQNVIKAANMVAREVATMQQTPVGDDELTRVKACLLRQIPLSEASVEEIARGLLGRTDLGLPLDEPTRAAQRYIALDAATVQQAFRKWLRPNDLVRISEGPAPP
ncbi:MAG TPA: pitrilysin family protein [Steroidobacteraceae bacterium]|nr:pitrilysin family protein [Steroidobacteraceae bacterium]